ncbi:MAG: ribose 5-phosphate isomerase B [Parcubacteria bacterium C7867-004]|nr:MAG: ribose 5-phosphate isomerase B [Parcubacteria bacterium C7867-004]
MPKLFIASDHTGFALKGELVSYVGLLGYEVEDLGAHELDPGDDYPDVVTPCALKVTQTPGSLGIVIGGSGQGEAMCANRVKGARAAIFYGQAQAIGAIDAQGAPSLDGFDIVRLAREHNDANILSLAARFITIEDAREAVRIFIETPFTAEERHVRRIGKF